MTLSPLTGLAKTMALCFTLALLAGTVAEARDHRGPSGMSGGGVTVSTTRGKFGTTSRNPEIRDHRVVVRGRR